MYEPSNTYDYTTVRVARVVGPTLPRLGVPVMTISLVLANLVMALMQLAASGFRLRMDELGNAPVDWALGAKVPSLVQHGEYWRLVTANFLHGDWRHLFFNVLGLLFLGRLIEMFFGPARLLVIYMLSCVAGAFASYLLTPEISLGASTGVIGLLGALLVHNFQHRRQLPARINYILPVVFAMVVIQIAMDFGTPLFTGSSQVDGWGHVGGLLGGMLLAGLLQSRVSNPLHAVHDRLPLPVGLAAVLALLAYGGFGLLANLPGDVDLLRAGKTQNLEVQVSHLERALQRKPHFAEGQLYLGRLLTQLGRGDEAEPYYAAALRGKLGNRAAVKRYMTRIAVQYLQEGQQAFNAQQYEAAAADYRRAVQFSEHIEDARLRSFLHNAYAWCLADKLNRNLEEAEKHARLGIAAEPSNAAVIDTLAWVLYRQRRYPEALQEQLRAVQVAEDRRDPRDPHEMAELYFHLGAIYEKLDERKQAINYYARALQAKADYQEAADALNRLSGGAPVIPPHDIPPPPARPFLGPGDMM